MTIGNIIGGVVFVALPYWFVYIRGERCSEAMPASGGGEAQEKELNMTRVEEIEAAIEALSEKDYVRLRRWFSEKDWREWDRQIEADSDLGKIGFPG